MLKKCLLAFIFLVLTLVAVALYFASVGDEGPVVIQPAVQQSRPISAPSDLAVSNKSQILFGDLHVHTSFSLDTAIFDTPAVKDMPYSTPSDACDFARYCSALDFWSINDHAEGLSTEHWQATRESIRQCNAPTSRQNPDMVAFLGWEWTQQKNSPDAHYGHKNVILKDIDDALVPVRPIASADSFWRKLGDLPAVARGFLLMFLSKLDSDGYENFAQHLAATARMQDCGKGDVRSLDDNCYEQAATPSELFSKLDEWGFDAMVIPHGLAWGTTNPVGADFALQMNELSDKYQRLLEVNSGHGNSEVYKPLAILQNSGTECPRPTADLTPCCWQAGAIIEKRCNDNGGQDCADRATQARQLFVDNNSNFAGFNVSSAVVPNASIDDWGQCDQLLNAFQPAYKYQAKNSAQYIVALEKDGKRFRPGFIGSSDNHSSRPGTGYKEISRHVMTDTKDSGIALAASDSSKDQPKDPNFLDLMDLEDTSNAFYFTGGLVAVHSADRSRDAIWQALQERRVYGTSGPRIQLWFDKLNDDGSESAMGSQLVASNNPRFRVKAVGSLRQKSGCPDYTQAALGSERIASLCRNECFNPSDSVHSIQRIEIVRIVVGDKVDDLTQRIEDPWRTIACDASKTVCQADIVDDEYLTEGREVAYYARAVQEATPTIQGDPFSCQLDAQGQCVTNYCAGVDKSEDCLSLAQHRAWSSPIYLLPRLDVSRPTQ